jgi:hypothetical protein
VATADKDATDQKAAEEAMVARATREATVARAAEKAVTDKEATDRSTAGEVAVKEAAVGAAEDSPAPGMTPSLVEGTKRAATPSGSTPSAKRPYKGVWKPRFFVARLHSEYISFLHSSSSSGTATATGSPALATGTTIVEAAVGVTPGLATGGEPQTLEGVLEDVLEESEEEPEMAPELVTEVVQGEVPAEGAMIAVRAVTPSPSHGAASPSSSAPRVVAATDATSIVGLEVAEAPRIAAAAG